MADKSSDHIILNENDVKGFADDYTVDYNANYKNIGSIGLNRFANFVYEEFLPQLRWPQAARVYYEMAENDATIGAILYMVDQLVRKSQWYVTPASQSKEDEDIAKFVEECMNDMSHSWSDTMSEILSLFIYGWSFHEIIYKVRRGPEEKNGKYRSKYTDGRIGWRDFPIRSQHTLYGWRFSEENGQGGGPVAMIQWPPPYFQLTEIPFSKGMLFRTKSVRGNPEGRSLLRNSYRSWYFKKRIEEIEGIGIERDLAGLPVLQPPENVNIWDIHNQSSIELKNQAEQIVRNIRRDKCEGVVIPFGWKLELLASGGKRQFDTSTIINRYDQRIAMTMLADIIMMGADKVGSFALGEVKKSLMASAVESLIENIADIINKYAVPTLMRFNAMKCPNGYPKITPEEIESPSLEDIAKIFKATGLKLEADIELYNYVRKLLQIEPISEEDFNELMDKQQEMSMVASNQFGNKKGNDMNGRSTEGDSFGL